MLHAIDELAEHGVGHIERILRDEVDAHAFRTDQAHHLLDLFQQRRRGIVEQQMRLVEEEHQLRLLDIAHFRQPLEQFRHQPQQEGGVDLRRVDQLVGREHVDHAAPLAVGLHQIIEIEGGFAEQPVAALLFDLQQPALDGADRRGRDVAVAGGEFLRVLARVLNDRAQVLQVEQQQAVVVGDLEGQAEHALLGVVEVEQPPEQQRSHLGDGGAYRMPGHSPHIPERHRKCAEAYIAHAELVGALLEFRVPGAGLGKSGEVAFDVGHEHRHADGAELLGQALQGHGLAGAGGAGDQSVAVGQAR